jgi:hypothetical protein
MKTYTDWIVARIRKNKDDHKTRPKGYEAPTEAFCQAGNETVATAIAMLKYYL